MMYCFWPEKFPNVHFNAFSSGLYLTFPPLALQLGVSPSSGTGTE